MSTLTTLVRHEVRDARLSLIAAPCVSAAVLAFVHALLPLDFAVSNAAATCVGILVALWTVYFAADLFATDCASGRMSTKALLPVSSLALWRAKIAFLALAVVGLATWTLGCEYALQLGFGTEISLAHFEYSLQQLLPWAPFLVLVAAAAVLCSLVVEGALAALLLSLISAGLLVGLGILIAQALRLTNVEWSPASWFLLIGIGTALLVGLGALAFVHGQRHLGLRRMRARVVLWTLGALLLTGGLGTASEIYRRATSALEHPRTRFNHAVGSPDGRYLALQVEGSMQGTYPITPGPRTVWILDLETGRRDLVAWPGTLARNGTSVQVLRARPFDWGTLDTVLSVQWTSDGVQLIETEWARERDPALLPAWADVSTTKDEEGNTVGLNVRWNEHATGRSIVGDDLDVRVGWNILLSPRPGRLLTLGHGVLALLDMEHDDSSVLIASGVRSLWPSPDGSAVIAQCDDAARVLSTIDGTPLHEPWPKGTVNVQWVEGEGSSRAVRLSEVGPGGREFVKDLDTGIEFELRANRSDWLLHKLGSRGYVFVDTSNDLVWVDPCGVTIKVLVDR